ncbi:MAG: O-antigen ligase family protein [Bacteroidales bacterium]|nr:O-antigen ligase family protein [Bacteroidales bacterium]
MAGKFTIRVDLSAVFIFLSVLVIPFVYSTAVPDPSLSPRVAAISLFNLAFIAFLWAQLVKNRDWMDLNILKKRAVVFYAAYVFFAGISVFYSINSSEAVFEWMKTLTFFLFFCLAVIHFSGEKENVTRLIRLIVIFTLLISARGFFEIAAVTRQYQFDHQASYFIRAFSSNRNLFSEMLFLTLPFSVSGVFMLKKGWRILSVAGALSALILIVFLLTRSVWLALFISMLTAGGSIIIFRRLFFHPGLSQIMLRGSLLLLIVLVSGIYLFSRISNAEIIKKQLFWVKNYKYGSSLERTVLWEKSIRMVSDHPFTGVGQGNWRIAIPAYGLEGMRSESGEVLFQRPHNDFIWVLSENGIFGLIFYVLLFAVALYYGFRIIKQTPDKGDKFLALALTAGLTGYLTIAMLSFPKERVEHQVFVAFILALLVVKSSGLNPPGQNAGSRLKIPAALSLVWLLAASAAFISVSRLVSEVHINRGCRFRANKDYTGVISEMNKAATTFTTMDAFSTPLAWYRGEALFLLGHQEEALISFRDAFKANPNHLHVLNNLGTALELSGERTLAKRYYSKGLEISPRFSESLLNMCALLYNEKKYDSALIMLKRAGDSIVSARHERFLEAVLGRITLQAEKDSDDRLLAKTIERISNDKSWMIKVFRRSLKTGNPYRQELTEEAIYLLESVDSTIGSDQAIFYREKYFKNR